MREARHSNRKNISEPGNIRIRFGDGCFLQGTFDGDVGRWDWVCARDPWPGEDFVHLSFCFCVFEGKNRFHPQGAIELLYCSLHLTLSFRLCRLSTTSKNSSTTRLLVMPQQYLCGNDTLDEDMNLFPNGIVNVLCKVCIEQI